MNEVKNKCVLIYKNKTYYLIFIIFISLISCIQNDSYTVSKEFKFDDNINLLGIDYSNNPKESINHIIELSEIRRTGYGVIINLNNSISKQELGTLKRRLQKEDINAVHSYNIKQGDSVLTKAGIAIEGAKFIWLVNGRDYDFKNQEFQLLIPSIQHSIKNHGIVVVNKGQFDKIKENLQTD